MGASGTATVNFGTGVGVTQDATKKWWFPANDKEWKRLLRSSRVGPIPSPRYLWDCQGAGPSIPESYGSGYSFVQQAATPSFQQAVPGFSRLGIKPTDASTMCANAVLTAETPGSVSTFSSLFFLVVKSLDTVAASVRRMMGIGTTQQQEFQFDGTAGGGYLPATVCSGVSGVATGLSAVPTDNILGMLVNPSLEPRVASCNIANLRDVLISNAVPPAVPRLDIQIYGDIDGSATGSNAYNLYAVAWGRGEPINLPRAREIIRLMMEGPDDPFPGSTRASVTVTGQAGIGAGSAIEAWISGTDSTADHNAYEHSMVPIIVRPENRVNGVGFDVVCTSDMRLSGQWTVRWVWN